MDDCRFCTNSLLEESMFFNEENDDEVYMDNKQLKGVYIDVPYYRKFHYNCLYKYHKIESLPPFFEDASLGIHYFDD
jgi:hypothetical protein